MDRSSALTPFVFIANNALFIYLQNMKNVPVVITVLFSTFFVIFIGVHVVGLTTRFSDEPVYSHIIHTICYGICLYTIIRPIKHRTLLYSIAAVYPFLYHLNCAWTHYTLQGKISPICSLVVVLMPLGTMWLWNQSNAETKV